MSTEVKATATRELPTLKRGDSGSAVRLLQNLLISLNYLNRDLASGSFLDYTDTAVRNFQREYGLVADGIVGIKTWDKLGASLWG
jgi:peptidoglycan hydrolase-like protein with peptidoglycan-binding domain